jgi:hypothetical protein
LLQQASQGNPRRARPERKRIAVEPAYPEREQLFVDGADARAVDVGCAAGERVRQGRDLLYSEPLLDRPRVIEQRALTE